MSLFRFILTSDDRTMFTVVRNGEALFACYYRDMALKIVNHERYRNDVVYRWYDDNGVVTVFI